MKQSKSTLYLIFTLSNCVNFFPVTKISLVLYIKYLLIIIDLYETFIYKFIWFISIHQVSCFWLANNIQFDNMLDSTRVTFKNIISKLFKANNVLDVMHSVICMTRIFSINPFTFKIEKGNSKSRISIPYLLLSVVTQASYYVCVLYTIVNHESGISPNMQTQYNVFGEQLQIISGLVSVVFLLGDTFVNKDDLARSLEKLFEADELFVILGRRRSYDMLRFRVTILLLGFFLVTCLSTNLGNQFDNMVSWQSFALPVVLHFPVYQITFTIALFLSFLYMICIDLLILNREILKLNLIKDPVIFKHNVQEAPWKKVIVKSAETNRHIMVARITLIWQAYIKICRSSLIINQYFARKLTVIIALSFISGLFNLFFGLTSIVELLNIFRTDLHFLIISFSKCFVYTLNLVVIISSCEAYEQLVC